MNNMPEQTPTIQLREIDELEAAKKRDQILIRLAERRQQLHDALTICDRAASILERLPSDVIECATVFAATGELIFFNLNREQVKATISAMKAGEWIKDVNTADPTRLDYDAVVDGVKVQIFGAPPPERCRIVEREEDVPAHKKIVRELVCA